MGDEASSLKPLRRSLQRLCPNVKPLSFNTATSLSAARTTCTTLYLKPAAHRPIGGTRMWGLGVARGNSDLGA